MSNTVDNIINGMKKYLGVGRFSYDADGWVDDWSDVEKNLNKFNKHYGNKNIAPFYCVNNKEIPSKEQIKKKGLVCWGLTNLGLRHANVTLPFKKASEQYKNNIKGIRFGQGGSDEWIFLFQNGKGIEKFDPKGKYPKGTLLLRNFDDLTQGHTAILMEDSTNKDLMKCKVIHSAGDNLCGDKKPIAGICPGVCIQLLGEQEKYFQAKYAAWDTKKQWPSVPKNFSYYQAILRPEYYINTKKRPRETTHVASNKFKMIKNITESEAKHIIKKIKDNV